MKMTSSTSAREMTTETSINSKYHSLTSFIDNLVGIPELAEEKFKGATIMLDTSMYQMIMESMFVQFKWYFKQNFERLS